MNCSETIKFKIKKSNLEVYRRCFGKRETLNLKQQKEWKF